jgi:hypothetical protein
MRRIVAASLCSLAACSAPSGTGGVTARLAYGPADSPGTARRGLRALGPPPELFRLEILALEVDGSTLAKTVISMAPQTGEQTLDPMGGTWRLDGVKVGHQRRVVARGYFSPSLPQTALKNRLAMEGEVDDVTVRSGEITDVGTLTLRPVPGVRVPSLDLVPPGAPAPVSASSVPSGVGASVTWTRPPESKVQGYLLALSASASAHPSIDRGLVLAPQESVAPGVTVSQVFYDPATVTTTIAGLTEGATYGVLVYSFDVDLTGRPLDYSSPAQTVVTPIDREAPAPPTGLTVSASTAEAARIDFIAPADDGAVRPDHYDVRASVDPTALQDPARFESLIGPGPIPALDPGTHVTLELRFRDLGVSGGAAFLVGVRAVDRAGNPSAIAIASYSPGAVPIQISALAPEAALAGGELLVSGQGFGAATGTVTLGSTVSGVRKLIVRTWSDGQIDLSIPPNARSGPLSVVRAVDRQTASAYLPVLERRTDLLAPASPPFALVGAPAPDIRAGSFVLRNTGSAYELDAERFYGTKNDGVLYAPRVISTTISAVIGAYAHSPARRYIFASTAQTPTSTLDIVTISSSTTSAAPLFGALSSKIGPADSLALVPIEPIAVAGRLPALIAYSFQGAIYTATTPDLLTHPFRRFTTISSTGGRTLDLVSVARRASTGEILMAYRSSGPTRAQLRLARASGSGGGPAPFLTVGATLAPSLGSRVLVLDLGTSAGFLIAYEAPGASGAIDVWLLLDKDYSLGPGTAPFRAAAWDRRLLDVGLVLRGSELAVALLVAETGAGRELHYTEVPVTALGPSGRGTASGSVLDNALDPATEGRLGCKPDPAPTCLIAWLGTDGPGLVFLRR